MQLVYGSDGINFRVLDASSSVDRNMEKYLLAYSGYDFVKNADYYSSISNEPEAITYVSSNFNRTLSDETILISKSGHMSQYGSPSAYFHAFVKEVEKDYYKKQFFEIFNYRFVKDIDIRLYTNGRIDSYPFTNIVREVKALTNDQIVAILVAFMSNQKSGAITKIIIDSYGDAYNERVRDILSTIYRYLPYEMRKRHGFLSYSRNDKGFPANVSFVMFSPSETYQDGSFINLNDGKIDLSSMANSRYINYANYLVNEISDSERETHFVELSEIAQNGRLTVDDCLNYYINIAQWKQGSQEQYLPDWIDYIDKNSFRKGPLYYIMLKIIVEKVDNNYYNDYLFKKVLPLHGDTIDRLSINSAKTLRFADCLDEIYIDPDRFHEWYQRQQAVTFSRVNGNDPLACKKAIESEIAKLKAVNIMSPELDELLAKEIAILENRGRTLGSDINNKIDEEQNMIERQFGQLKIAPANVFMARIPAIRNAIKYPDSLSLYKNKVKEWFELNGPRDLNDMNQIKVYDDMINQLKDELPEDYYKECKRKAESVKTVLMEELKSREYVLTPENLLSIYAEIVLHTANNTIPNDASLTVKIGKGSGQKSLKCSITRLKNILEFLLSPNNKNAEVIIKNINVLFLPFIQAGLLKTEHFYYLIDLEDENDIDQVVEVYLTYDPVQISGKYAAQCLLDLDEVLARKLAKDYKADYNGSSMNEMTAFINTILNRNSSGRNRRKEDTDKKSGMFNLFK